MGTEHLDARGPGYEPVIHGIGPHKSIDLEMYTGKSIPTDWDITGVTGDIIMCEYADEADGDAEYVKRGHILLSTGATKEMWRVGKIHLAGPGVSEQAQPGAYIMFPNDKGIPITKFNGKNYIFINEERIFCFVQPKAPEVEEVEEVADATKEGSKG